MLSWEILIFLETLPMLSPVVAFPSPRSQSISLERWRNFCEKRRLLEAARKKLEALDAEWRTERDELIDMLIDGATIEGP